ncbi:DUF6427 family protein [Winogradskyella sp. A3E31]|uniref:DUF6427 family protein n=1 Tax=Winogradskyella sp. A3E31 TaxID=3349637 RepID=UPI00398B5ED3
MITSVFKNSKPINSIIVIVFITLVFILSNYFTSNSVLEGYSTDILKYGISIFSVFVLDFIISKNKLTKKNSYATMTFGLLFAMFPEALRYLDLLIANLLVLFALRRLISLHSRISVKKKLFDAGFWIGLASFFDTWALLFFLIIIVALIYYWQNDLKNLLVPFLGLATVWIIYISYCIIADGVFLQPGTFRLYASLDFTSYDSPSKIITLTIAASMYVWMTFFYFKALSEKNKKVRPSFFLVVWSSVIALLLAVISPVKNGSEFIFLLAPFSIIMANYLEVISERWFREVFVSLLIIAPIISLLL